MLIQKDAVVAFHYILRDSAGAELENSYARSQPQYYLHGRGQIVPGLESALEGKQAAERLRLTVPPEQAYGLRQDQQVRVPLKKLKDIKPLKVGSWLTLELPEGRRVAVVTKLGLTVADLDMNHPLAGQALDFEVEIVEVREATAVELEHGHAHPPGMDAH